MQTNDSRHRIRKGCVAIGIAIASVFITPVAFAQQTDPAVEKEAQDLLDSAVKLMEAKQFPPACRKLEIVLQKLPQATGARLELARCYRGEKRLASAWQQYVRVEVLARIAGQKSRQAEASKNATELARILGKLQIDVPAEVATIAGLSVSLDGQVQEISSWGTPIPVDALQHEIVATAPGRESWVKRIVVKDNLKGAPNVPPVVVKVGTPSLPRTSLRIEVPVAITRIPHVAINLDGAHVDLSEWADGAFIQAGRHEIFVGARGYESWLKQVDVQDGEMVVVNVPMLEKTSLPAQPEPSAPLEIRPQNSNTFDKRSVVGIVGVVAGGLSISAGAIFGGLAVSRNRASNNGDHCKEDNACDDVGFILRSDALTLAHASTTTLVLGGVLAATGIVLLAISPSPKQPSARVGKTLTDAQSSTKIWFGPTSVGIRYAW